MDENKNYFFILSTCSLQPCILKIRSSDGFIVRAVYDGLSVSCSGVGGGVVFDKDYNNLYSSGYQFIWKSNQQLNILTKYAISDINCVDKFMKTSANNFYISSFRSSDNTYLFQSINFDDFSSIWATSLNFISCSLCADQLQHADYYNGNIYFLILLDVNPFFGVISELSGNLDSKVFIFSETCSWLSFIKANSEIIAIGFQVPSNGSILKIYKDNTFNSYSFSNGIQLYGFLSFSYQPATLYAFSGCVNDGVFLAKSPALAIGMLSDIVSNTVDINQQSPSPATSSFYPSIDPPVSNILSMITPSTDLIPLSCVFRQKSGIQQ